MTSAIPMQCTTNGPILGKSEMMMMKNASEYVKDYAFELPVDNEECK